MKTLKDSYKGKRPPSMMRNSKCSSPVLLTPTKSPINSACHSPTSFIRKLASSKLINKTKNSTARSPDSIKSTKTSAEETQSSSNISTLAIRLKLETRSSPRSSLRIRPESIKPLILKYEDDKSRGNSPVNRVNSPVNRANSPFNRANSPLSDKFYLTIHEEAISRPYCESDLMTSNYKETSYGQKMVYWRKKKIQQYRIAKNIQEKKLELASSPCRLVKGKDFVTGKKCKSDGKIVVRKNGGDGVCAAGMGKNEVEAGKWGLGSGEWDGGRILNRIPGSFSYSSTPVGLKKTN
jgi:hypothetical protein